MPLSLTSPAFSDGDPISEEYGYTERNVNPPLEIEGVPSDAESLALIMDDPDAIEPAGKIWEHWLVWNIDPGRERIPEGWNPESAGAEAGENDFGEQAYGGPNPPDREHTYRFELYALDTELDLPSSTTANDLRDAVEDHVIAEDDLHGTYTP
ncbi:MAG: Raf kinase inhibitor-like YbhB/YbcL family protein [Natronomonas sp.]|jgi:Raf kinase inhibitor-like YbhB/YbcL family protein|uniref:YbhB/YbcL family Raf kinase inhibitor-like protein n=1 Tax=Natronomonas sp. TaxID=2184060 RepID=UPI003989C0F7